MTFLNYTGWDIGGAHLKVASVNSEGKVDYVEQIATPLWQGLKVLEQKFPETINRLNGQSRCHSVTMTGELVDIFKDRNHGISSLLDVCESKLGEAFSIYASDDGFITKADAPEYFSSIASTNWHASASFTAKNIESGLFIDIGSTTTDIIPFNDHKLINKGINDQQRLTNGELVYTGVVRTPLMALAQKVPFKDNWQLIAAEHFATTADVYRILDLLKEADDLMETSDGMPKDIDSSYRRLARMLGADLINKNEYLAYKQVAEFFAESQMNLLKQVVETHIKSLPGKKLKIVGAGTGSFLARKISEDLGIKYTSFSELFDADKNLSHAVNVCAPAVALAMLNYQEHS